MLVRRSLPSRDVRTVGAWCFVDHIGPVDDGPGMHLPPHPHTGLQTVTWLMDGRVEHRDSVGSHWVVAPGELSLMTAGRGIAHSEHSVGPGGRPGRQHGVQLWIALPDASRHGEPHAEHHRDLPRGTVGAASLTVLVGTPAGTDLCSPATAYTPLIGMQVDLPDDEPVPVPLDPLFEHAVLPLDGEVWVAGTPVPRSALLYLEPGRTSVQVTGPGRVLLLGGEPLAEELVMWWNFVGRDHDEVAGFRRDWQEGRRFGGVDDPHPRLPAPELPGVRLRARPGRRR
jgi:redox-sensitive bicupin YhaK (pirin superfamily)